MKSTNDGFLANAMPHLLTLAYLAPIIPIALGWWK